MQPSQVPIIGIGASAGGIDAFRQFFATMPTDSGMAFVVILHLPADRKSMLTEILRRWTSMRVLDATDGIRIEPNCVYVPPPHTVVTLLDGHLSVEQPPDGGERMFRPIDGFFDSLGAVFREQSVGIVLSGTGNDGALGLKAIKECGGLTIAQGSDVTAPQYGEMPASAVATGAVDLILPVEKIAEQLVRLRKRRPEELATTEQDSDVDTARLKICNILRARLGHDFSLYRSQTFLRRVARRMQVLNVENLDAYVEKLKANPDEANCLLRDLLIRVTSFFRDGETFEILAEKVIPRLFEGKGADGTVRVWVPGCATGEEAYSLAMLLREHMDELSAAPRVQLFATDIDETAITAARSGRYPPTLLEGLSDARRDRFFRLEHGGYVVSKEVRELCTFSAHNLIRDPPFSLMSVVSCRNLLIYMNPDLQARIIPLFHYALIPHGVLLLGGSESVAHHGDIFEVLDKTARIFIRRPGRGPELNLDWPRVSAAVHPGKTCSIGVHMQESGHTSSARQKTDGVATSQRRSEDVNATIASFQPLLKSLELNADTQAQLQAALAKVCGELQALSEQHQTALEELRSSNEELHSVNEEMQSTNEELETSKEELQSLNEELHTVNLRLTEKIDELAQTNSDLRNLFDSTEIATIFLDRHLIVRSFTPAIASLYNLIPSDQGRPLTHFVSHLKYNNLREDVAFVLSTLEPLERRVMREDGCAHYVMRILPYREPDSTVSGVLVTFVDVTNIVQAEEALVAADARKDVFLATLSHELRNPLAPIRNAAQLLRSPKLGVEELKHAQQVISRQVTHLSALLDDLLDVSRITRGSFQLKKEYVDVQTLLDGAVETVQPLIDAKQHTLRVDRPAEVIRLEVDPVRITQVITNLLTNAVKYTPKGGLLYLGTRLDGQHFVISVRDSGIGLSPEAMDKVFDMFTRIESDVGRSEGGLGIGLALAKGLVELHGGKMRVSSAGRGQGSEFLICLPRTLMVQATPPSAADSHHGDLANNPRRILVADDNRDSATTLGLLLEQSGHEVHLAHSGEQALELAKETRPDVGVFDIGMPDLSGYEVAERIRHEAWGREMTLIAVTGWGQESDRRRALAAGFNHHLTKPVDPDRLEILLRS